MKRVRRWVLYGLLGLALALSGELPFQSRDVGKLLPVETSLLYMEGGQVVIRTDLGLAGRGDTWEKAVQDLEARAPGVVFYDTGEFLLLHRSALPLLEELPRQELLRGSCAVCRVDGQEMDLTAAGAYLRAQRPETTLRRIEAAYGAGEQPSLPELQWEKEGFRLVSEEG